MTTLPTLYKLNTSTGKIQVWAIATSPGRRGHEMSEARINTTYGLLGGKQQNATEMILSGKNLGKANETTPYQQAQLEAKSQWEKKVKKGYVPKLEDAEQGKIDTAVIAGGVEPMLAQSYDKHASKITFPAYVQPKLDGHRCIAIITEDECTLWSRTRKRITGVPHIAAQLHEAYWKSAAVMPSGQIVLDGELYNHDYREKFEELTSFIRQVTPKPGHEVIQYWVYDMVIDGYTFDQRIALLSQLAGYRAEKGMAYQVQFVDTEEVKDEEDMIAAFGIYMSYGFEGLMLRNLAGMYKYKRSYDLQKVKLMQDAEFEIVDITEGKGKMAGKAMFEVITTDGKPFRVKMKGTLDSLSHYLDHKEDYIGKQLTVKYQNLSADGIPRFPIGERIRVDV